MRGIKEIIQEAAELPVEERAVVVDSLLRTLNAPDPEIDKAWTEVAKRRLVELRSGRIKTVPGDQVFARIRSALEVGRGSRYYPEHRGWMSQRLPTLGPPKGSPPC